MWLYPKKKHYKKLIAYIKKHEPVEEVKQGLIDALVKVGIDN